MTSKNRKVGKKVSGKASKKAKKLAKKKKPQPHKPQKTGKPKKPVAVPALVQEAPAVLSESAKEGTGFKISIDRIDGNTVIGDLIVVFPRTRGVLQKHGLRLNVEDAGDIYMSLEAFAALQGVKTEALIQELEEASKEPPPQPPQPVPQLAAPPTA